MSLFPFRDHFGMIPFDETFYHDSIRISRASIVDVDGNDVVRHTLPVEVEEAANVQTQDVERIDPDSGRLTVVTRHFVRTRANRALVANDWIFYTDLSGAEHTLNVVGPSTPLGIGDVAYLTECVEIA